MLYAVQQFISVTNFYLQYIAACEVHSYCSLPSCSFCSCNTVSQTQHCVNNRIVHGFSTELQSWLYAFCQYVLHGPFINCVSQLTLSQQQLLMYQLQVSDCAHRAVAIRFVRMYAAARGSGGMLQKIWGVLEAMRLLLPETILGQCDASLRSDNKILHA